MMMMRMKGMKGNLKGDDHVKQAHVVDDNNDGYDDDHHHNLNVDDDDHHNLNVNDDDDDERDEGKPQGRRPCQTSPCC